jgi:hypothetical protein
MPSQSTLNVPATHDLSTRPLQYNNSHKIPQKASYNLQNQQGRYNTRPKENEDTITFDILGTKIMTGINSNESPTPLHY